MEAGKQSYTKAEAAISEAVSEAVSAAVAAIMEQSWNKPVFCEL